MSLWQVGLALSTLAACQPLFPVSSTPDVHLAYPNATSIPVTPESLPGGLPPTYTPKPVTTGIFDDSYGRFVGLTDICSPTNHWVGVVNNEVLEIYAGGCGDLITGTPMPKRGVLVIVGGSGREEWLESPAGIGVMTILNWDGARLQLGDQSGQVLYFDIPTRTYLLQANITSRAPTVTPFQALVSPTNSDPAAAGENYP